MKLFAYFPDYTQKCFEGGIANYKKFHNRHEGK